MRYIRTKDNNIYEISDKQYDVLCGNLTEEEKEYYKNIISLGIGSIEEGNYKSILIKDIIKQADNLKELCDLFITENDYCGQISQFEYYDFEVARQNLNIEDNDVLYGAIRVAGKGIFYVAKMNNEGDLKLL